MKGVQEHPNNTPKGSRFSRTAKLLADCCPPCSVTGNMTLRDCISGIGLQTVCFGVAGSGPG
jgi:hypothetical protein